MGFCRGFHRMLLQVTWFGVLMSGMAAAAGATQLARPNNCMNRCGDVEIPFPFGVTEGCYLSRDFQLRCNPTSRELRTGDIVVTKISLQGQLEMKIYTARQCFYKNGSLQYDLNSALRVPSFTISNTENKFMAVGCDTSAFLRGIQNNQPFSMGCMTICRNISNVFNGTCSGIGCCQVEIPRGLKNFTLQAYSYERHTSVWNFNPCSYAFVVKKDQFIFSSDSLRSLKDTEKLPMVVDWAIGNETCDKSNPICGQNSECHESNNGYGYRCKCKGGYDGNPYLPDGCQDINECDSNPCDGNSSCVNKPGHFICPCNNGYHGDGRRDGPGCAPVRPAVIQSRGSNSATTIALVIGVSVVSLLVGGSWLYLVFKKRKLIELKKKFFEQNGGLILKDRLKEQTGSAESVEIFTVEELKKATKNFDESRIIGQGGFGTVYKGILQDNRTIAIKRSRTVDQGQIDQFVNEIVILSRINHGNVVKLLGCCLETKVPLLVYEFVPKGSLYKYIRYESNTSPLRWETRLRIATEIAEALSYLHSATPTPIIHRDIKSANILLDDDFIAKVSDFGTSKLVPQDQKEVATMVQGTFGYLDPEYLQSNQLTEKSDVYSFGVVLVELLTGEEVFSANRSDDERNLANYFLSSLKEGQLFDVVENCIVEEGNKEHIKVVLELAKRCLKVNRGERPTMKEVVMELEVIRKIEKHLTGNPQSNPARSSPLHVETSEAYKASETSGYDSMTNQVTQGLKDGR